MNNNLPGIGGFYINPCSNVTSSTATDYFIRQMPQRKGHDGMFFQFIDFPESSNTLSGKTLSGDLIEIHVNNLSRYTGFSMVIPINSDIVTQAMTRDANYAYINATGNSNTDQYVFALDLTRGTHKQYLYNGSGARTYYDSCAATLLDKSFAFVGASQSTTNNAVLTKVDLSDNSLVWENRVTATYLGYVGLGVTSDNRLFGLVRGPATVLSFMEIDISNGDRVGSITANTLNASGEINNTYFVVTDNFVLSVIKTSATAYTIDCAALDLASKWSKSISQTTANTVLVTKSSGRCFVFVSGASGATVHKLYEATLDDLVLIATITTTQYSGEYRGMDYDDEKNLLVLHIARVEMHINPDVAYSFTVDTVTWVDGAKATQSPASSTPTPVTTGLTIDTSGTGYVFAVTTISNSTIDDSSLTVDL